MKSSFMAYLLLLPGVGVIVLVMGAVLGMAFSQSLGFFQFCRRQCFFAAFLAGHAGGRATLALFFLFSPYRIV
ncbi:hypothetical protein OS42_21650 [Dickeya oryzae]